ncbi:MAG: UPF0280 family protein [Pseudomonadota bacterium]
MTGGAVAAGLPDGRLHLQHGPIDIILSAEGPGRDAAFRAAARRFETILPDLAAQLPVLTRDYHDFRPTCPVAAAMKRAVAPLARDRFVTPMAAVAGAVADEICASLSRAALTKATANNGGDIAFLLSPGARFRAAGANGPIDIPADSPVRGMATSGWQGRSQSLGIADAVTVLAETAARADAAATLIANAVDLPDHPAIQRVPASDLEAVPQLDDRLVTVDVGALREHEIDTALNRGAAYAKKLLATGLIAGAILSLKGISRVTASSGSATGLLADPS